MYEQLLDRMADDIEAGGITASAIAGHEAEPDPSALALRLAGAVHRLVLVGTADRLETFYPSVGGAWDLELAWPVVTDALAAHLPRVRELIEGPPQTNDIGRSSALLGGLLHIAERTRLPVSLTEIGSSAGLNLRFDAFGYTCAGGAWGPEGSPVVLADAWAGRLPPVEADLKVAERRGVDAAPLDPTSTHGRLALTSYVWPDDAARLARLRGAFEIAARVPVDLVAGDAADAVEALELRPGATTVLWHSVVWQYLGEERQQRIRERVHELGSAATDEAPFAHLRLEPSSPAPDQPSRFLVTLQLWPSGEPVVLGESAAHGIPTTWE